MTLALFVLLALAPAAPAAAAEDGAWLTDWAQASAAARKSCRPVLVEIGAPWCQACRAMEEGVLSGADFRALGKRMVLVRSDADEAEGKALQKRYLAPFLPSFLFIGADGREVGRMVGWQPAGNFLTRLSSWLKRSKEAACTSSPSKT